jgi:hypothetical protein
VTTQQNAEYCIRLYKNAARAASIRGDMRKAQGYGERARMWIQRLESLGELDDGRRSAFHICKVA